MKIKREFFVDVVSVKDTFSVKLNYKRGKIGNKLEKYLVSFDPFVGHMFKEEGEFIRKSEFK